MLLVVLGAVCLEFWHKDVGIIPTAIKQDSEMQRREFANHGCAAGEKWNESRHCVRADGGDLVCSGGCVKGD
jgi:hypothetical protein